jgi:hypothetical protein
MIGAAAGEIAALAASGGADPAAAPPIGFCNTILVLGARTLDSPCVPDAEEDEARTRQVKTKESREE